MEQEKKVKETNFLNNLLKFGICLGIIPFTLNPHKSDFPLLRKLIIISIQILIFLAFIFSIKGRYKDYYTYLNSVGIFLDILEASLEQLFFFTCFTGTNFLKKETWKSFTKQIVFIEEQFNYKSKKRSMVRTYVSYGCIAIFLVILNSFEQFVTELRLQGFSVNHVIFAVLLLYECYTIFLIIESGTFIGRKYHILYVSFCNEMKNNFRNKSYLISMIHKTEDHFLLIHKMVELFNNVFGWHIVFFIASAASVVIDCLYLAVFDSSATVYLEIIWSVYSFIYTVRFFWKNNVFIFYGNLRVSFRRQSLH